MITRLAHAWLTRILGLLLFLQAGLVLTGGIVRVTGSGLGCPTWPECTDGSIAPTANQVEGTLHSWIEFGNRLLTFVLVVVAIKSLLLVLITHRKDLRLLALGQIAGILGQGILGGITVLTHLNPIPVAGHYLLSTILIAAASSLHQRSKVPTLRVTPTDKTSLVLSRAHLFVAVAVLVIGTIVTGSGPHAGDVQARRFPFLFDNVAWLHADLVIALFGITLALYVHSETNVYSKKRLRIFITFALLQGLIGYTQYFLNVPEVLVALHLLGSTLVWIATWRVWLSFTTNPR
ncbi:MAG: hypothetical protein F2814_03155 [Actinobacteria bacterium]|nr:hypothetical protein [Actinomycetota bacterium]